MKTRFISYLFLCLCLLFCLEGGILPLFAQNTRKEPSFLPVVTVLVVPRRDRGRPVAEQGVAFDGAGVGADLRRRATERNELVRILRRVDREIHPEVRGS